MGAETMPVHNLTNIPNPIVYRGDDYKGRAITLTVPYLLGLLLPFTIEREAGCLWSHVLFGIGEDGMPDSCNAKFWVGEGGTTLNLPILNNGGLITVHDLLDRGQITVGR